MTLKLTVIAAALFAIMFGLVVLVARNLHDAAWLVAVLSMPASSVADVVARLLAGWFGSSQKGIFLDLGILFACGVAQYGALGFIVGTMIDLYRNREIG